MWNIRRRDKKKHLRNPVSRHSFHRQLCHCSIRIQLPRDITIPLTTKVWPCIFTDRRPENKRQNKLFFRKDTPELATIFDLSAFSFRPLNAYTKLKALNTNSKSRKAVSQNNQTIHCCIMLPSGGAIVTDIFIWFQWKWITDELTYHLRQPTTGSQTAVSGDLYQLLTGSVVIWPTSFVTYCSLSIVWVGHSAVNKPTGSGKSLVT